MSSWGADGAGSASPGEGHRPLHAPDRRLDVAFATLTDIPDEAFLHCLHERASSRPLPEMLAARLPRARWIPVDQHPLTFVDPVDHLQVHQAWMAACHGEDRVAHVEVRTVAPLDAGDGGPVGHPGTYTCTLIDMVGTEGIDAVIVTLIPLQRAEPAPTAVLPPPRGARSFRLRLDLEGTIIGGTTSVVELLGRPLGDLVGTAVLPLIHPDDLEPATGVWEDVLDQPDQSQNVRIRLRHRDGSWRWFADTAWNALDDPDTPGVISEFHDIHALVEAEQALHASELGFRTLAESLPVGVAVLDQDGRIHFANHQLVSLILENGLGGPQPEDSPTPRPFGPGFVARWSDLVVPDFAAEVADLVRPHEQGDAPVGRQVRIEATDGRVVHLLIQAVTIRQDETRSVIVSVQDVTGEVRTSRAHARLVQAVDVVDDVVVVSRGLGEISYLNQAAKRFLGPEAIGQPVRTYLSGPVARLSDEELAPLLRDSGAWTGDLDATDLEGRSRIMSTTVTPVEGVDGELHIAIIMRDVTAERAHERELARQARRDVLTHLPNRFALVEMLEAACRRDADDELAVFFIDLDNLKVVNDGLGHSAGDRLLVAVAEELRKAADGDAVARFGGDEFVIVCEGLGPDDAVDRGFEFLRAVEQATVAGVASHVSASIGVATARRREAEAEALLRDADAAMYVAKKAGRGRCARFDDMLRSQVTRRFRLESDLRTTIDDDQLDVHVQPILALADGRVTGVEALCRWNDVSPGEFIPIAEESGLVVDLGAQVLRRALDAAAALRAAGPELADLRVGVNVSARELELPDFADRTLAIIANGAVPASCVVLELTESVLLDPRADVLDELHRLQDAGIGFALDDFGAGYSGLTYLRHFPLETLKLDISYTRSLVDDLESRVIVESLVSMADRLGLRIVAEGVETEEQLQVVTDLGITWAQGYLIGRPVPWRDLLRDGARGLSPLG